MRGEERARLTLIYLEATDANRKVSDSVKDTHRSVRPRLSRRDLLRTTAAAAIAVGTQAAPLVTPQTGGQKSVIGMPFEPRDNVRMALIGCGERGTGVLGEFLAVDGVQVTAVCDLVREHALGAQSAVEQAGQKPPAIYAGSETAFEKILARDDVDFYLYRDPVGLARPAGDRRHEERQARLRRSPRSHNHRGLLETCRHR